MGRKAASALELLSFYQKGTAFSRYSRLPLYISVAGIRPALPTLHFKKDREREDLSFSVSILEASKQKEG